MRNAVGFYWTLPVPWAGFTELPEDIEAAAGVSSTIRYQMELIRRHAKEHNYRLIAERAFLEIAPDRGSSYMIDELLEVEDICRVHNAVMVHVDFSSVGNWRRHGPLDSWIYRTGIKVEAVSPDEVMIDGHLHSTQAHFSDWRERQKDWTAQAPFRKAEAFMVAESLRNARLSFKEIATALNAKMMPTSTGKGWTEDTVRALLAAKAQ